MTRKKKLLLNTVVALIYQVITVLCGFILPRYFIPHYGSAVNGMISSITQFLGVITLLESGVGAVVQSSFYKPLANHDEREISRILISSKRFFNRIILIMAVYVAILMVVYPFIINESFGFPYTSLLVLVMALSYVAQHYLFLSHRLLLNADQMSYLQLSVHSICLILNCIFTIVLIKLNASVHFVKLVSALVFALQPIVLKIFVDHRYNLDMHIHLTEEPIKQKWNGFAQHISNVILGNTDTIVLTVFSTLESVSVYSVYYMVVHGLRQIINSMLTGVQALLGNMYANRESEILNRTFSAIVILTNNIVVFSYGVAGILLIPFVQIYTKSFVDANYIVPSFGIMITLAYAAYSIRLPYELMIRAAGHYKQTQTSSFIEAGMNIVISILLVKQLGLIGVAIGTFVAMVYRTLYLVWYLSKKVLCMPMSIFFKIIIFDVICVTAMVMATSWCSLNDETYKSWIMMAIEVSVISITILIVLNLLIFKKELKNVKELIGRKVVR